MVTVRQYGREVMFIEDTLDPRQQDKVLHFGPLPTTLGELYDMGWVLQTYPYVMKDRWHEYKVKYYLVKNGLRYAMGKIRTSDYSPDNPPMLSTLVRDNSNLLNVCSTAPKEPDPFTKLMEKYPVKRKATTPMVGNQTLKEYVVQQLSN